MSGMAIRDSSVGTDQLANHIRTLQPAIARLASIRHFMSMEVK